MRIHRVEQPSLFTTPPDSATPTMKPSQPSIPDIKPRTPVVSFDREQFDSTHRVFAVEQVAPIVGMSPAFVRRVTGQTDLLSPRDVLTLLDQDAFRETYIPRSRILAFLEDDATRRTEQVVVVPNPETWDVRLGNALDLAAAIPMSSVQCVVTSTPYWGMRVYEDMQSVVWADGDVCPYGHEQTPEGFVRHTVEMLVAMSRVLTDDGSIWWNVMDTFMTRTQIRGNAAEALRAMQGKDAKRWHDHASRRYSAGHAFLKDGEQCLIPQMIAERASRAGLYVKTVITWAKRSSMPEPQNSRVSRNLEYVLHLAKQRTPKFFREPYLDTPAEFGGRNNGWETEKLSDVWTLNTSVGGKGHGAQFPVALPGRCIALTTEPGDLVLDPFVGSGTSGIAALHHQCRFIGIDASQTYLAIAKERLTDLEHSSSPSTSSTTDIEDPFT